MQARTASHPPTMVLYGFFPLAARSHTILFRMYVLTMDPNAALFAAPAEIQKPLERLKIIDAKLKARATQYKRVPEY